MASLKMPAAFVPLIPAFASSSGSRLPTCSRSAVGTRHYRVPMRIPMLLSSSSSSTTTKVVPKDARIKLEAFANKLADAAGKVIKPYYRLKSLDVISKLDKSPVTIADQKAEQAMVELINAEFPDHVVLGEEFGSSKVVSESGEVPEFQWVLDPIDGTKAFVTGKATFGTLIALLHNGRPVLGVIDQVITNERWVGKVWDAESVGTFLNGERVHADSLLLRSTDVALKDCFMYTTTPEMFMSGSSDEAKYKALAKQARNPLYGADCYAYALLSSGYVQLVVEADLKPWDYCALVPVVQGAGGVITDWNGKELGVKSDGRVLAAYNRKVHDMAIALLKD